jgi:F0F1-type ATP synthase epsilon subunit
MINATSQFILVIMDRDHIVFEGMVVAVSSVNDKGPFDVLEQHAQFISLIKDVLKWQAVEGNWQEMAVSTGIIRVFKDKVTVFLGVDSLKHLGKAADEKGSQTSEDS